MTIYIGTTTLDKSAIRTAAARGVLRRIAREVYTDNFDHQPEQLIKENLLSILGKLYPMWHFSFSTAATLVPIDGLVFLSGSSQKYLPLEMPGIRVIRLPDLKYPEVEQIEAPTLIASKLSSPPESIYISLSSPLQTVFECISTAKHYPQKLLPEYKVVELIGNLSSTDRKRAEAFAVRNDLKGEYWKYLQLCKDNAVGAGLKLARPNNFAVYFYGWEIGNLIALQNDEFRFEYSSDWKVGLSPELSLGKIYESRKMPAFFENLLPEGWTESQLQATFKIAREDRVALLATTQKYLSNLTLRTSNFNEAELVFDTLDLPLSEIAPEAHVILKVKSNIEKDTSLQELFRAEGKKGPMRISGIQPKLPVHLIREKGNILMLSVGTLRNSCSYIIKYQSPLFPNLVENEWATMELAKRVGLPTAAVRQVEFRKKNSFPGRALLIERYDIPRKQDLDEHNSSLRLALQQDVASLLKLYRQDKYKTSAEKIAEALIEAGTDLDQMNLYFKHLLYSWIIGNGDLHAKNVSIIFWLTPGQLGATPARQLVTYSPLYDLVNTRLHLKGDKFALTINGKNDKFTIKDFAIVGARWGLTKVSISDMASKLANEIRYHLQEVLELSGLSAEQQTKYSLIVDTNISSMKL